MARGWRHLLLGDRRVSSAVRSYRDLVVWQRSMELADMCREIACRPTRRGGAPRLNQMLRAAVSIPANIAEGSGRRSRPDFLRHLSIANGSLKELETHLMLVERAGVEKSGRITDALATCSEIGRMLSGLMRSLRNTVA